MIINTSYRLGSYIDLCRCPCDNGCFQSGCWQTSCPPFNCPPEPCGYPCNRGNFQPPYPCNNFSCCYEPCKTCIPQNALFFLAGYMLNKNTNKIL